MERKNVEKKVNISNNLARAKEKKKIVDWKRREKIIKFLYTESSRM